MAKDNYTQWLFNNKSYYNEISNEKEGEHAKRMRKRAVIYNERNGYWTIFNRAAEAGVFNKTGYTPFEALRLADGYTVLKWYVQDKYKL